MSGGGTNGMKDEFGVWNPVRATAGEEGFDPLSYTYHYGRDQGMTSREAGTNAATGGFLSQQIISGQQRREMMARTAEEKARIEAEQKLRDTNRGKLRALFGLGDSPDASSNAKRLHDYLDTYYRTFLGNELSQVDRQYGDTTRRSRQNLARVGQLGSGLETSSRRESLSDYLRGRQEAVARAGQARSALDSSLSGQRMSLEQQINAGSLANPDYASYARQQQATIDQAQAAIPANQIGQLFDVAGESYRNGRLQETQGNQGLSAFWSGGGSSGGKIS